jgi:hypothetical protein
MVSGIHGIEFADPRVVVETELKEKMQYGSMEAVEMYWSVSIL